MANVSSSSALIGRSRELAAVRAFLGRVETEGCKVMLLSGEAGIGKSAFTQTVIDYWRHRSFDVLEATGDELATRQPLRLISEYLGSRRFSLASAAAGTPLAEQHPDVAAVEYHAFEAMMELVGERCERGPVLLVAEDLHWADASSLRILRRVVRDAKSLRLAVLCTLRPSPRPEGLSQLVAELAGSGASELLLGPLDEAAVVELATTSLRTEFGDNLAAQLSMAGGNPLFVLELLDALRAEGALTWRKGRAGAQIVDVDRLDPPPSLLLTVLHRLSYLDREILDVLGLASVLGTRFSPRVLGALTDASGPELLSRLEQARATGVLRSDGDGYAFRHEIVREALYTDLAASARPVLHQECARVLARIGAPAGVIAEHWYRSLVPGDDEAIRRIGELSRELAVTSPDTAADLLESAVGHARRDDPRLPTLKADLAVAWLWSGRSEKGEALCRTALQAVSEPSLRTSLRQSLVESLLARGQPSALLEEVDRGRNDPTTDPRAAAHLNANAALAYLFLGDLDASRATAAEVSKAAEHLGDVALAVQAMVVQALLADHDGRVADAIAQAAAASSLADYEGSRAAYRPWPHPAEAMALLGADRFAEAESALDRAREAEAVFGGVGALPILHVIGGFSRFWSGRWDDAIVEFETGVAIAAESGTGWRAAARGLRAMIALARDDVPGATRWLSLAEAELASGDAPYRVEWLLWARARLLELGGQVAEALQVLSPLLDYFDAGYATSGVARVLPDLTRLARSLGDHQVAERAACAADEIANANPGLAGLAGAQALARGIVAEDLDALVAATGAYERAGRTFEAALAAEEVAAACAALGRSGDAKRWLASALGGYEGLGARGAARLAAHRLRSYGVVPTDALGLGRPPHGWESLTPMERRVLRLVCERRSNSEIAQVLVVSRRTVETHVAHIFAKVGLHRRTALADAAAKRFGWQLRLGEVTKPEPTHQA
ncbi:MAG: AAA family ATPase [Actinomycetota bacterium]|nr:AAA family ATPase [Actinomycetota bacterium]